MTCDCDNAGMAERQEADDPFTLFTQAASAAIQLHGLYRSYVDAGFSEGQAMRIICTMISSSARQHQSA